jgi:hypothetical protein
MNTVVFHSSSLGVTEYAYAVRGLAAEFECDDDGVHTTEGTVDEGPTPIVGRFSLGLAADASGLKRMPQSAYIAADGTASFSCTVTSSAAGSYTYPQQFLSQRMRRFVLGRGVRDNYLGFAFSNPAGGAFRVDMLEVLDQASPQRKI